MYTFCIKSDSLQLAKTFSIDEILNLFIKLYFVMFVPCPVCYVVGFVFELAHNKRPPEPNITI